MTRVHADGATNGIETSARIGGVVERVQLASAATTDRRAMRIARRELTRSTGARAKRQPAAPVEKRRVNVERALCGMEPAMTIIGLQTEAEAARESAGNARRQNNLSTNSGLDQVRDAVVKPLLMRIV